jgi:glycosyltransferase involved in cell wall biosynthesis
MADLVAPAWVRGRLARIVYEQCCLSGALRGRCDLLHCPGYVMPLNWRGPSVLTVHDLIALQFPRWCKRSNVVHYRIMLPRSIARATAVLVPSETTAQVVGERYPEAVAKLRVVPVGIDECYRPASEQAVAQIRQRLHLPERFLLCVGNIEPKKNLAAVVKAFDQLAATPGASDLHLVIAGKPAWDFADVTLAVGASAHRGRIHLPGYVAAADMPALYTAAALLVQWSLYEGVGLPPLEAMACGTPVVVSDGGALPEVSGPAARVVPLGPPERLAEALETLVSDEAALADLRQRGLAYVARFTWHAHARAVAALYEEIVNA